MRKIAGVVALLLAAQVQAEEAKVQVVHDRPAVRGSIIANLLQDHDNPFILTKATICFIPTPPTSINKRSAVTTGPKKRVKMK